MEEGPASGEIYPWMPHKPEKTRIEQESRSVTGVFAGPVRGGCKYARTIEENNHFAAESPFYGWIERNL
jgi:hypothetical protein